MLDLIAGFATLNAWILGVGALLLALLAGLAVNALRLMRAQSGQRGALLAAVATSLGFFIALGAVMSSESLVMLAFALPVLALIAFLAQLRLILLRRKTPDAPGYPAVDWIHLVLWGAATLAAVSVL